MMTQIKVFILLLLLNMATLSFGQTHRVEKGETLYGISKKYNVKVKDLYRVNPDCVNGLKSGMELIIPGADLLETEETSVTAQNIIKKHTIQPKETLYSISRQYGVTITALTEANQGLNESTFTIGKEISIPTKERSRLLSDTPPSGRADNRISPSNTLPPAAAEKTINTPTPSVPTYEPAVPIIESGSKFASKFDGTLKIGLILPFSAKEGVSVGRPAGRYVEFYEGFLLALDSLKKSGINIDVKVFDEGAVGDKSKIDQLINSGKLNDRQMIVGPAHNENIPQIIAFAAQEEIKVVLPFSSQDEYTVKQPHVFLVNTPYLYLWPMIAEYVVKQWGQINWILVDPNTDLLQDKNYKKGFTEALVQQLNSKRIGFQRISFSSGSLGSVLKKDQRNIIVPTSSGKELLTQIADYINVAATAGKSYPLELLGHPEYQTYMDDLSESIRSLNTSFYTPFYSNPLDSQVKKIQTKFIYWYGKLPFNTYPKYGLLGYDIGYFFISSMHRWSDRFMTQLPHCTYESLQNGFNLRQENPTDGFLNKNVFMVEILPEGSILRKQIY